MDVRFKVLGWSGHLLVGETSEDLGNNLVHGFLVVCLEFAIILLLTSLLAHVKVNGALVILLKLHHNERIPGLTLSQRRVQPNNKQEMQIVGFGEDHEFLDRLVLNLVVVGFAAQAKGGKVHVDVEAASWGKMQNVLEGSHGVACSVPNIGLVQQRLVEELCSLYFLIVGITAGVLALCLLLGRGAWHIQSHLDELVYACGGFAAFFRVAVDFLAIVGGKLDSNLVAAGKVGIRDLGVGYLKGGSVLNIKGKFTLGELCLSPVPAPQ